MQQMNGKNKNSAIEREDCLLETKHNETFGRYSIAKDFIPVGTVLFEEKPFVVGPKPCSLPICLECCCPVDGTSNGPRCLDCKWPLCDKCQQDPMKEFHPSECEIFSKNKVRFQNLPSKDMPCLQLDCITPLRILLAKEEDPDRWIQEVSLMEYHLKEREDTPRWKMDQVNIVGYLRGPCKLKERFSEELIQRACGILEVNSFEGKTKNGHRVRCIFPKTAIMAHSCVSNTIHSIMPMHDFKIVVRSSAPIERGEMLCMTYTYTFSGTLARQEHLKEGKYFTCQCVRCLDPTELGTFFSSINCQKCGDGNISPLNPLDASSEWQCSQCKFKTTNEAVASVISNIETEINVLQNSETSLENIHLCEQLLKKYLRILHSNHFLLINFKETLIEKYGWLLSNKVDEIDTNFIDRKVQLCQDVLKVLDVIQPGLSRTRAMLLYEIYITKIALLKKNWDILIDLDSEVAATRKLLQECLTVFEWEDESSLEQYLARICKQINAEFVALSTETT